MLITGHRRTGKTMACPNCGTPIPLGAVRCSGCHMRIFVVRKRRKQKRQADSPPKEKPPDGFVC